jgi:hypothetical protein
LATAPLWPCEVPRWAGDSWGELVKRFHLSGDHWHVWITWYNNILQGSPRTEGWELAFTDLPEPLPWDKSPEAVNRVIAARLEALPGE